MEKYCVNCDHYKLTRENAGKCLHPHNQVLDLVTGKTKASLWPEVMRVSAGVGCTARGDWFEEKSK